MGDGGVQVVALVLRLKDGSYTRVEKDLTENPKWYAVDQQNEERPENKVHAWRRSQQMVFCVYGDGRSYLLKVDGRALVLEETHGTPDVNRLADCYWFSIQQAAPNQQFRIHSESSPALCLTIKEETDSQSLFDLGDSETNPAVFVDREKICW